MSAGQTCQACGLALRDIARFCDGCGAPTHPRRAYQAEYKQVTVLFADVVGSMRLAARLGPERLREIMMQVFDCSATAVERYGGTVDSFTGDGLMAVFGAPVSLEDHALRACLAALDVQAQIADLADDIGRTDNIPLALRIGLNSGQVVAGEIRVGTADYALIGEQVGMAQRMESAAPAGGVLLSESTARLVDGFAAMAERELVTIKGSESAVPARRLLGMVPAEAHLRRWNPTLIGRTWELTTLAVILRESVSGRGSVSSVVGPPGIGKSRVVAETAQLATNQGIEVFSAHCESHTSDVPFIAVARLLRSVFGIQNIAPEPARELLRAHIPDADPEDVLLLDDLVGIGDPAVELPDIRPDARQRRLGKLLNAAAVARTRPAVYVVEDVHWIDATSEAMLAEFLTVVPRTHSFVLVTYRPEYQGQLSRMSGSQTIVLSPLSEAHTRDLVGELVGMDESVAALAEQITEKAEGNPFFVEEITRDLAERGVLEGARGDYRSRGEGTVSLPETLQATIGARIDRLDPMLKHALNAAAILGARFDAALLDAVLDDGRESAAALHDLLRLELIDQVQFAPRAEYAFRHPLTRAVAYESQLVAARATLHRRVAEAIERRDPLAADQNAALIAEHLEAAGRLSSAFAWHMRAGAWLNHRDLKSARASWQRARQVADRLPQNDADRLRMQIESRTLLCATAFLAGGDAPRTGFEELRNFCGIADDKVSLAIGMSGMVMACAVNGQPGSAADLADDLIQLVESIGDPALTIGLSHAAIYAKGQSGSVTAAVELAQRSIALTGGDPTAGGLIFASPLALATGMLGMSKLCLGMRDWLAEADAAIAIAAQRDPTSQLLTTMWKYILSVPLGALVADNAALSATAEAERIAERTGDNFNLGLAQLARGIVQIYHGGQDRDEGIALLTRVRSAAAEESFAKAAATIVDPMLAMEKLRRGDVDGAIELARAATDMATVRGELLWLWLAVSALVESLLCRGSARDVEEAAAAVGRLSAVPTDDGFILHRLALHRLSALIARALGDDHAYTEYVSRLRTVADEAGFEAVDVPA